MLDALGRPILMSPEELIEFYRTDYKMQNKKHVKHDEGCPWRDGKLVKKTMVQPEQPITLRVVDKPAAAAVSGFARGGINDDDYEYEKQFEKQLQQALKESLQLSRPSGPGAAVRRQEQGAAAAALEPEDDAYHNAISASIQETENPIQEIRRRLRENGIDVPEEAAREEFQTLSGQTSTTEEAVRQSINVLKWPRQVRVMNRVRDELNRLNRLISDNDLRNSVRNMLEHEPNEERAAYSVVQLFTQQPQGGKKSKIIKSRRGKKSKIIKSRKGKKSKMTKSRRGKKSKMTRKKV
jgi:hypothetical protein